MYGQDSSLVYSWVSLKMFHCVYGCFISLTFFMLFFNYYYLHFTTFQIQLCEFILQFTLKVLHLYVFKLIQHAIKWTMPFSNWEEHNKDVLVILRCLYQTIQVSAPLICWMVKDTYHSRNTTPNAPKYKLNVILSITLGPIARCRFLIWMSNV